MLIIVNVECTSALRKRELNYLLVVVVTSGNLTAHSDYGLVYMLSSKYGFGQSMDCLHKVWILTLSGQSMDCLLNPRIELAQSTDWGNPWIGALIKGWYPLWLSRGGLLVSNTE